MGGRWFLPHELQWEKAARGVDGRLCPWGPRFEASWTNMQHSLAGAPGPLPIAALSEDIGPFGMVGAAGNVRDLCANAYTREPPAEGSAPVLTAAGPDAAYHVVRGGSWSSSPALCRLAGRFALPVGQASTSTGFRLITTSPSVAEVP